MLSTTQHINSTVPSDVMELLVADCRCRAEPQGRRASLVNPMLKLDGLPNVRLMSALSGHSDRFIHFSTVF